MRPVHKDWLRKAGLRATQPRLAVLDVLDGGGHLHVSTIVRQVRIRLGRVSNQTVYDILDAFDSAGIARRIEPSGGPARFSLRAGDNHHHLVCRECAEVVDVDGVVGEPPCLTPSASHGYVVDEAEIIFWGFCPACLRGGHTQPGGHR